MWLLIGYGSMLHTDDRFGPTLAEAVRGLTDPSLVEVHAATQLTPEMIEPISRVSGVIFVDAGIGILPGQVDCLLLSHTASQTAAGTALSHHCTPELLLEGARMLYGHAPPGWLYVVGGESFELGDTLSPCVEQALPATVSRILKHLQKEPVCTNLVSSKDWSSTSPRG